MIILEGWDISHFKDDILIKHVESSNPFLHKGAEIVKVKEYGTSDFKTVRLFNI